MQPNQMPHPGTQRNQDTGSQLTRRVQSPAGPAARGPLRQSASYADLTPARECCIRCNSAPLHRGDEGVPEHMRVGPADPHSRGSGQIAQPAGGGGPVHPASAAVEQDRSGGPAAHRALDGPSDSGRQRHEHYLGALAADPQYAVPMLLAEVGDVRAGCLEIRSPSRPSIATSAKSYRLADSRAAVSIASNCRWVNPSVGDSGGTAGRRTCSTGECSSTPFILRCGRTPR